MHAQRRLGERALQHLEHGETEQTRVLLAEMLGAADRADPDLPSEAIWSCVVADQHAAMLQALPDLLGDWGFDVVATVGNGRSALRAIETQRPDVALLDASLPDTGGVELTRRALAASPETAVAIYSGRPDRILAGELIEAGASAVVYKGAPLAELRRALETVAAGGRYADPVAGSALLTTPMLTEREREVLHLLAEGCSREEVGERLGIGPGTVRAHLAKANRRLGARNRTHAVALAQQLGLI